MKVWVDSDGTKARQLQQGHGGWDSIMEKVCLLILFKVHFSHIMAYDENIVDELVTTVCFKIIFI